MGIMMRGTEKLTVSPKNFNETIIEGQSLQLLVKSSLSHVSCIDMLLMNG